MPAVVPEATVNVAVELPEPVIDEGLKPTVTPEGCPEAVKVTAESKPSTTVDVIVEVPVLPAATETEVGEAERVKSGVCVEDPARAAMRPAFGLPHPVTRS